MANYKTNPVEYRAWLHMKTRCLNPNYYLFHRYGGRGIKPSESWMIFENFLKDVGPRPSSQHSLDRIDNNKGYCKENCRWANTEQQANNTSKNKFIELWGKKMTLNQWARYLGMKSSTLRQRYYVYRWPIEVCFTKKLRPHPLG